MICVDQSGHQKKAKFSTKKTCDFNLERNEGSKYLKLGQTEQTPVKIYLRTFLLDTYNFSGWFPTAMPGFGLDSD